MSLKLLPAILWATAAFAGDPFVGEVPGAKAEDLVTVPGIVISDGIPTRLRQVHSKLKIDELFQHFYRVFNQQGLYIAPEDLQLHTATGYVLTGIDPKSLIAYTVIFQESEHGGTTLILGSALPANKVPSSDPMPVYPGAKNVLRTTAEGHASITYEVSAKEDEVTKFYSDTLGRGGFVPKPDEKETWKGPGGSVHVSTNNFAPGHTGVLVTFTQFKAP